MKADIDIDTQVTFDPRNIFPDCVVASRVDEGNLIKHPVGVYFQDVPVDPFTKLSAIPFRQAEDLGFLKIDFLHISVLDSFKSKEELRTYAKMEPNWDLLSARSVVTKLFQIANHYDLVQELRPRSVLELADAIALIRPNKRALVEKYLRNKEKIRNGPLYIKEHPADYRKCHAVAYALVIVTQLHLIEAGKL
jgi:hypothetical protein